MVRGQDTIEHRTADTSPARDARRTHAPVTWSSDNSSQQIPIVVAAPPGPFRQALRVLLQSFPNLAVLLQSAQPASIGTALQEKGPAVLLVDGDAMPTELSELLAMAKTTEVSNCSIVLVTHWSQALKAEELGADAVLLKGFRASELEALIDQLWLDLCRRA